MTKVTFPNGRIVDFGNRSREEILKEVDALENDIPSLFINQNAQQTEPTVPEPSKARQLEFGYETGRADYENLGIMLEAAMPVGELIVDGDGIRYDSPEEMYGPEFSTMNYDQRRQFLSDRRDETKRDLFEPDYKVFEEEFSDIYKAGVEDSAWSTAGKLGAAIASPTSLIPIGQTYKMVAATSGGLGALYSTLDQEAKKGNIDLKEVAVIAGASAVAGPLLFGATRFVGDKAGKAVTNYRIKRQNKKNWSASNAIVEDADDAIAKAVASGVEKKNLLKTVKETTGIDTRTLNNALNTTGRKLVIPNKNEADIIVNLPKHGVDPVTKKKNYFLNDFFGILSTEIAQFSKPLMLGLRRLDMNQHVKIHNRTKVINPLTNIMRSIPKTERERFKSFLLNGDANTSGQSGAKNLALLYHNNKDEVEQVFSSLTSLFDKTHKELVEAGYKDLKKINNYFPRKVKDLNGLKQALGKETKNKIEDAISKRKDKLKVKNLSDEEVEKIINNVLRGYRGGTSAGKLSSTQKRTLPRIPQQLLQYYDDPIQTLDNYIRSSVTNIEKRKFFGQKGVNSADDSLNMEESIAQLINRSNKDFKDLDDFDIGRLTSLLESRFISGEQSANQIIQAYRNAVYMMKLGNPIAALTQLGDIPIAGRAQGFRHIIGGMFNSARKIPDSTGKKEGLMESLGLDQVLASEFVNEKVMSKWVHKAFTAGGFRSSDKFGKNVLLQGALNKGQAFSKTPKGQAKLASKYKEAFGADFDNFVDDLATGKMSENVKLYLWSELADVQPISLSEMPKKYLDAPNGRLFYTLKTFGLKQLDVFRREAIQEWKKGNKIRAARHAVTWASILGMGQVGTTYLKDAVSGREPTLDPEEFKDRVITEYYKLLFLNRHNVEKALPSIDSEKSFLEKIGQGGTNLIKIIFQTLFEFPRPSPDLERNIPVVGELYYRFSEKGKDKYDEQQRKKELKRLRQ